MKMSTLYINQWEHLMNVLCKYIPEEKYGTGNVIYTDIGLRLRK